MSTISRWSRQYKLPARPKPMKTRSVDPTPEEIERLKSELRAKHIKERIAEDAVPAACPQRDAAPRQSERGTGSTTSPLGSSTALIKRKAERQSPAHECGGGEPLDDCVQTMGSAPGGRGRFEQ